MGFGIKELVVLLVIVALVFGTKKIKGEVWQVNDETLEQLDAIEGYPEFYNRIPTETTEGKALMYFLGPEYKEKYGQMQSTHIEEFGDTLEWKN